MNVKSFIHRLIEMLHISILCPYGFGRKLQWFRRIGLSKFMMYEFRGLYDQKYVSVGLTI